MNASCNLFVLLYTAVLACPSAAASEEYLLDMLTCKPKMTLEKRRTALNILRMRGVEDGNGRVTLNGPLQVESVCIRDVQVSGAFGVFSAVGSICNDSVHALIERIIAANPALKKKSTPLMPGVVAEYHGLKVRMMVFRGNISRDTRPNPASSVISYSCAYRESGPQ